MNCSLISNIIGSGNIFSGILDYELVKGNQLWRFLPILVIMIVAIASGRIAVFILMGKAAKKEVKYDKTALSIFIKSISKPVSVALFALGLFISKMFLVFGDEGINPAIGQFWMKIAQAVGAIALAYALFRLVDVLEYYLVQLTSRTKTKLDDMLVPVIRKSLRVTISIIAALWIADGILGAQIRTILLGAGVGGIAVALAAKDTIANFFGSITIFADRPFQVDQLVRIGEHLGFVEEVGFRSSKIRTLQGHLVTIPNNTIANSMIENVGSRPYIRRTSNITITYDSGNKKTQKAVDIIKEVLADVPEINSDQERPSRVYFSDFNDWSLNIYVSYWVKPADYWLYHQVNERVNFEIMKRFEAEKIEFAFPSQTLYLKKE